MANLKISEDLFLESQELNRLKRFLETDGFKQEFLLNTSSFGIVKGYSLPSGITQLPQSSFLAEASGFSLNINAGRAIDKYANILTLDSLYVLPIPVTGLWYWIKIKYRKINYEVGTVSIDINGNLTGTGTYFTDVLRGQPNFTTKIKFTNATLNTLEYDVVDVVSDGSAILSGDFVAESNLTYAVVGAFTPGFEPATADKLIYEYDDVEITIVAESSLNIPPAKTENEEFYIARVRSTGDSLELQDKRTEFWKTRAEYEIYLMTTLANPIIGIESVKWNLATTAMDQNEINIAWGYRTINWSINTSTNTITINSGTGGILKEGSVTSFVNGMFDGWRIYTKTGKYFKILSSTKTGTQINLKLDYLNYDDFESSGEGEEINELHIVPDVEEIEIRANYDSAVGVDLKLEQRFVFPIYFSIGKMYVRIYNSTTLYKYNLTYRYKNIKQHTGWQVFPNDAIGYYAEHSFDDYGVLKTNISDREQKPYNGSATLGFCEIVPNPANWNILFGELITGDVYGIEHRTVTNVAPVISLVVGSNKQHQVMSFDDLTLSADIYVDLSKFRSDDSDCINGNRFIIQMEGTFTLNEHHLRIVTDYVNSLSYTLVREIELKDQYFITQNQRIQRSGLVMIFTYDGTNWWLSISNEMTGVPVGTIVAYGGDISNFDNTGLGITGDVLGWALCNGATQAGVVTKNLKGRVIVGLDPDDEDYAEADLTGGSVSTTLNSTNLPLHQHAVGTIAAANEDSHIHTYTPVYKNIAGSSAGYTAIYDAAISGEALSTQTNGGSAHTHALSGSTANGGGQASPNSIDNRQPYSVQLYIQKII